MEYGTLLDDALTYTREGIFADLNRWAALILAVLCLGIPMNGYVMRIYRGASPAPEVERWGTLFIDGLKLMVVGLVYAIPMMIVWTAIYGGMFLSVMQGTAGTAAMENWSPDPGLLALMYLIEILVGILMPVASIRFARTGSFPEAFNIGAIVATIRKIGWVAYLIALIVLALVVGIPIVILILGFILIGGAGLFLLGGGDLAMPGLIAVLVLVLLILSPLFGVFQARYLTRVYDTAEQQE
jgi:hypothetical protein